MTTSEFISELRAAPQNQLVFVNAAGHAVHASYHLTELKAASYDTVDCAGQVNRWQETIVQLWVPFDPDDDYMTAARFVKIFDQVRGMIPLEVEADVRIEYGDENFFPSIYHVRSVVRDHGSTRVLLEPPVTTCKAHDRQVASDIACCA
jgi:hypothetical protein